MRPLLVAGALLGTTLACGTNPAEQSPSAPPPASLTISPRSQTIAANSTYTFLVTVEPSSTTGQLTCSVDPTSIGTAAATPGGCRLQTGAQATPGKLIATLGAKSDTAFLVVLVGGAAR